MHKPAILADVIRRYNDRNGSLEVLNCITITHYAYLVIGPQDGCMAFGQVAEIGTARDIVPNVNRISATLRAAGGLIVIIQNTFHDEAVRTCPVFFNDFRAQDRRAPLIISGTAPAPPPSSARVNVWHGPC